MSIGMNLVGVGLITGGALRARLSAASSLWGSLVMVIVMVMVMVIVIVIVIVVDELQKPTQSFGFESQNLT